MYKKSKILQSLRFKENNLKEFLKSIEYLDDNAKLCYEEFINSIYSFEKEYPNFIQQINIRKIYIKYEKWDDQIEIIFGKGSYIPLFFYFYLTNKSRNYSVRTEFYEIGEDIINEGGFLIYE